ncbi:hypothetical protein PAT3040_01860, partial [Paenibacillus agaridevorans]
MKNHTQWRRNSGFEAREYEKSYTRRRNSGFEAREYEKSYTMASE